MKKVIVLKLKRLIKSFISEIYFKDSDYLRQCFINICETFDKEYNIDNENENETKKKKIIEELFSVFSTNDFIKMADYLEYSLLKECK